MRSSRTFLATLFAALGSMAFAQGPVFMPLSGRPVPGAERAMLKSSTLHEYFIYQYETIQLPIFDDFSVDRTRKRWAQAGDAGVTYNTTYYTLEVGGVSTPDMVFMDDTTFTYTTDTVGVDSTWRNALPEISLLVYDISVYPPVAAAPITVWPAYNIFDTLTITLSPEDTLDILEPDHVQDSLLVYDVAAAGGTYTQPDNSTTPYVLWQDDDVFVNGTYPLEPPTIGVATFDGLSRTGYPYNYTQWNSYGIADHLTTVPIDLSGHTAADSIYLSFFYQPRGISQDDIVQPGDSLVLEFYSPF
ncbi:MAG TPA: hypothetical protein PK760_10555, partial [Flavobacteriales bacterium]|nr:hypothetical protein [Flavobacteriales bacterium]